MKKILVSLLEGAIVGVAIAVIMIILGIDATPTQLAIFLPSVITITSVASAIGRMINTGESPIFYEWVYNYGENRIEVSIGLTEKLYINDELVDEHKKIALNKVELKGKLKTGEEVKVAIIGGMTAKCELYVDNQLLQPIATKTP